MDDGRIPLSVAKDMVTHMDDNTNSSATMPVTRLRSALESVTASDCGERYSYAFLSQLGEPTPATPHSSLSLDDLPETTTVFISVVVPMSTSPYARPTSRVFITHVLAPRDPRNHSPLFNAAKKKELQGLHARGVWKVVTREELPPETLIIGARFVNAIKNIGTDHETPRSRFVAQGHTDKDKEFLIHHSTTISHVGVRVLVIFSVFNDHDIWSTDADQAYLQSKDKLQRAVAIRVTMELSVLLGIPEGLYLLLQLPLYGLTDSGDYWHETLKDHFLNELGMRRCVFDPALYFKSEGGQCVGVTATYVDDNLSSGNRTFEQLTDITRRRFACKPKETGTIDFAGIRVSQQARGYLLHHPVHAGQVEKLQNPASHSDFMSLVMKLAWQTHSRPRISCPVALLTQVTQKLFDENPKKFVKLVNKVIDSIREHVDEGIRIIPLNTPGLHIRVYADAAFANTHDQQNSQLGYIICLVDGDNNACVLAYKSFKSRRVLRGILDAETAVLAKAFDLAYILRRELSAMLNIELDIDLYTDSKSLFDVIVRGTSTSNKRLMIDIAAIQQAYQEFAVHQVYHISGGHNPADVFTKLTTNSVFDELIAHNRLSHDVQITADRSLFDGNSHDPDASSSGEGVNVARTSSFAQATTDDEAFAWFVDRQEDLAYASDDEYAIHSCDVHPGPEYELTEDSFDYLFPL